MPSHIYACEGAGRTWESFAKPEYRQHACPDPTRKHLTVKPFQARSEARIPAQGRTASRATGTGLRAITKRRTTKCCEDCHMTFLRKGNLQRHQREARDIRDRVCVCGHVSCTLASLIRHRKTCEEASAEGALIFDEKHPPREAFNDDTVLHTCEDCGHLFQQKGNYTDHKRKGESFEGRQCVHCDALLCSLVHAALHNVQCHRRR